MTAPVIEIQQQINGEHMDDDGDDDGDDGNMTSRMSMEPIKFPERRRIAEASQCDPSTFAVADGFDRHVAVCQDMAALCKKREFRQPRLRPSQKYADETVETASHPLNPEPNQPSVRLSRCARLECLFCLNAVDLPPENKMYSYRSKHSLSHHVGRYHSFEPDHGISCPDPGCAGLVLQNWVHFKNHAKETHNFFLGIG